MRFCLPAIQKHALPSFDFERAPISFDNRLDGMLVQLEFQKPVVLGTLVATNRPYSDWLPVCSRRMRMSCPGSAEYRQVEFARRQLVEMSGVKTWIVSREDLILSKLVWAKDANSELQRRDVKNLLDETVDQKYLEHWAQRLSVKQLLEEIAG